MNAQTTEILELKFEGNNISPYIVKPSEIAKLIENFERAIVAAIKFNNPEIDTSATLISFQQIDDKSLDLRFIPVASEDIVIKNYRLVTASVSEDNYRNLPSTSIKALKEITRFSKKYKCSGKFYHNQNNVATFAPEQDIDFGKSNFISGETIIYGRIIDIGGEQPNVHFKTNEDSDPIIISVKKEAAQELAPKLYKEIGLKGSATWDSVSYEVIEFKFAEAVEYEEKPLTETFSDLKDLLGKYWDEIDNIEEVIG